jgi:hypothetical protein
MRRDLLLTGLAFALTAGYASAQDGDGEDAVDGLEVTMTLMPEGGELPELVMALIELPKDEAGDYIPNARAVENAARGHETANAAREDGRAFGAAMAAAARENREDASRGGRPDLGELLPANVPNVPEIPNFPELPEQAGPPERPVTPPGPPSPPGQG